MQREELIGQVKNKVNSAAVHKQWTFSGLKHHVLLKEVPSLNIGTGRNERTRGSGMDEIFLFGISKR
jgi:hypothetical protein